MEEPTAQAKHEAAPAVDAADAAVAVQAPSKPKRQKARTGIVGRLVFVALVLGLIIAGFSMAGRAVPLPVWLVAEVEARLNTVLERSAPGTSLALGAVDVTVEAKGGPRLRLEDVRLLKADGEAVLTVPEVRLAVDGKGLMQGETRLSALQISGARLAVTRAADGSFDFALGSGGFSPKIAGFADLFALANQVLADPALARLGRLEADALTLVLTDKRIKQRYELGDGRLTLDNREDALAVELSATVTQGNGLPGRVVMQALSAKAAPDARLSAEFNDLSATDLAGQFPILAPLGSLEAPLSGRVSTKVTDKGVETFDAGLSLGKGALRPTEAARPIEFDSAAMGLHYDAASGQIQLRSLEVESPTLRATAKGQAYMVDGQGARIVGPLSGQLPARFLAQIAFDEVKIDPEGVFAEPVAFSSGALDVRLTLAPFLVELGQLSLVEGDRRLRLTGRAGADDQGWSTALNLSVNQIAHDRLLALWPRSVLAKTRGWLEQNLLQGSLSDIEAALRLAPKTEPRLHLTYQFDDATVRFMPSLPPVEKGKGYSTIQGLTYTMVLNSGAINAPMGGAIDMAGSVFAVRDVSAKPAIADIRLNTRSSLTATLSLLDLPPFQFMTKADRPIDLGQGTARMQTRISLPLQKKIGFGDVTYVSEGTVQDFQSDRLVPKRSIRAKSLSVRADAEGLVIEGAGDMGQVPFDVRYVQKFGPEHRGKSRVEGKVTLSQAAAEDLGLGLPKGMVSGQGPAEVTINLTKGAPGEVSLSSSLAGIGLSIPELGWSKAPKATGNLTASVTLGAVPVVDALEVDAGGLSAKGSITLRAGGGLELARFSDVTLDRWLDASVDLRGQGAGKPLAIAVTSGAVDMRYLPSAESRSSSGSGKGAGPLRLSLDRLIVTPSLALTDFAGDFTLRGGLNGDFTANVNGGGAVSGAVVPSEHGTAVRLKALDAGRVIADAGIFSAARGGAMDLTLTPRPTKGHYDGLVSINAVRVRNASVLAELLNAVSVVGLLEQLNGQGIVFNTVEGAFLLTPQLIDLQRGSAEGASLGVSMAGVYQSARQKLSMEGVISPVYLLNGVGAAFTKRGEGFFGFDYTLQGTADQPEVSVNPLSILTPGMFRDLFRARGRGSLEGQ